MQNMESQIAFIRQGLVGYIQELDLEQNEKDELIRRFQAYADLLRNVKQHEIYDKLLKTVQEVRPTNNEGRGYF